MTLNPYTIAGLAIVLTVVVMALLADFIAPYSPIEVSGRELEPPNSLHIMGTDNLGRDVFQE